MESKELELKKWQEKLDIKFGESIYPFKTKELEKICEILNYLFENFKIVFYLPEGGDVFNFGKVWIKDNEIRMFNNCDETSCITIFEPEELEYNKISNNGDLSYIRIKIKEGESKINSYKGFPDEYTELENGKILDLDDELNNISDRLKNTAKSVARYYTGSFLILNKESTYRNYEKKIKKGYRSYHDELNFEKFREIMKRLENNKNLKN